MDETISLIGELVEDGRALGRSHQIATANVDFLVNALDVPELRDILQQADVCLPDGMPVVWGASLVGMPIQERVAGADLVPRLVEASAVDRMANPRVRLVVGSGRPRAPGCSPELYPNAGGLDRPGAAHPRSVVSRRQGPRRHRRGRRRHLVRRARKPEAGAVHQGAPRSAPRPGDDRCRRLPRHVGGGAQAGTELDAANRDRVDRPNGPRTASPRPPLRPRPSSLRPASRPGVVGGPGATRRRWTASGGDGRCRRRGAWAARRRPPWTSGTEPLPRSASGVGSACRPARRHASATVRSRCWSGSWGRRAADVQVIWVDDPSLLKPTLERRGVPPTLIGAP